MQTQIVYDGPVERKTMSMDYGRYRITISPDFGCRIALRTKENLATRIRNFLSVRKRINESIKRANTIPSRREVIEGSLFSGQINGHRPRTITLGVNEERGYLSAMGYDELHKIYHSTMPLPD